MCVFSFSLKDERTNLVLVHATQNSSFFMNYMSFLHLCNFVFDDFLQDRNHKMECAMVLLNTKRSHLYQGDQAT